MASSDEQVQAARDSGAVVALCYTCGEVFAVAGRSEGLTEARRAHAQQHAMVHGVPLPHPVPHSVTFISAQAVNPLLLRKYFASQPDYDLERRAREEEAKIRAYDDDRKRETSK